MSDKTASASMSKPGGDVESVRPVVDTERVEAEERADILAKKVVSNLEAQVEMGNRSILEVEIDNGPLRGTISMRRPSLDEERQIGVRVAKYLQGSVGTDMKTENLAIFFATFDVCVDWDKAPQWFKPREMYDYTLLNYVYGRFAEWLRTFRGYVPPESQSDSEPAAEPSEVVDSKGIQSSTD